MGTLSAPAHPVEADLVTWCLLLIIALGTFPMPPADPPPGVDGETASAFADLDHPDWRQREAVTVWLVQHADRWARRVPNDWAPRSAEARWRWERVRGLVSQLEALPSTLNSRADLRGKGRLAQLREETGSAFLDALERCLQNPESRVRSQALDLLGETLAGRVRLEDLSLGDDPSPRVRECLYEIARRHDREWALGLLVEALSRDESNVLVSAVAEGAKRLGDPRLLPALRKRFRESSATHPDVVIALAAFGRPEDADAVDWLLRSPEYRHASLALDALGAAQVRFHSEAISGLLSSVHWDLRVRALRRLEEGERQTVPYRLLPLLEQTDEEVYLFAVENLVRLGGEDFIGDIEISLRRFPPASRPFVITVDSGRLLPRPVPFLERGLPVRAITPGIESPDAPR